MRKEQVFMEYGSYHQDARNRLCHAAGIPLIILGSMGLLSRISAGPLNLAVVAGLAVIGFYATIDIVGAIISGVIFALLYFAAIHVPLALGIAALVAGWIFQLIGHRFEGNRPKFLENILYLFIGPLYIFEELVFAAFGSRRAGEPDS